MTEDKHIVNLLRSVYSDANLNNLVQEGLRYSQISQLIESAIEEKYLVPSQGTITVTQRGLDFIHRHSSNRESYSEGWIRPLEEMRIEKMEAMSIFLPGKGIVRKLRKATSTSGFGHRGDESSS